MTGGILFQENCVYVRIFHGSIHKFYREKSAEPKVIGGFFGGHVAVQIDDRVYGFYYADEKKIHLYPQSRRKNCLFQNQSLQEWEEITCRKRETVIEIPVTAVQKAEMFAFYQRNLQEPEKDYSFIGERCASSCFHLLMQVGIIRKGNYMQHAFYPERLRLYLISLASKSGFAVYMKDGSKDFWWTGRMPVRNSAIQLFNSTC